MDFDTGFTKITKIIALDIIKDTLLDECGYQSREILLFGFGQGGMAALAASTLLSQELGGIISIGGPFPLSKFGDDFSTTTKNRTPILVLGGSSNTLITETPVTKIRAVFEFVEYHRWNKTGDTMPRSRDEMLPIMQFFARRLRSRRGVPEGSVEIG